MAIQATYNKAAADPLFETLQDACSRHDTSLLAQLLDHKPGLTAQQDTQGWSALHVAVSWSAVECVDLLLGRGAVLTLKNHAEETPEDLARRLCLSSIAERLEDATRLHEAGAARREEESARRAFAQKVAHIRQGMPYPVAANAPLQLRRGI